MTASDQLARPPDAPPPGPEWKKIPGVQDFPAVRDYYEFSHRGQVRSLDHTTNGRFYGGTEPLKLRPDPDDYLVVNITLADGTRKNGVSVARLVLLAHDPGGYAPGLQACHGPGGKHDNRWPENIRWDTPEANWREALDLRMLNNPPAAKPLKVCVRCGAGFDTPGRRCHACRDWLAEEGARLLAGGMDPEQAAREVDYPSAIGLIRLGMKHAGLRFAVTPREDPSVMTLSDSRRWLHRVTRRRTRGGDAQ